MLYPTETVPHYFGICQAESLHTAHVKNHQWPQRGILWAVYILSFEQRKAFCINIHQLTGATDGFGVNAKFLFDLIL